MHSCTAPSWTKHHGWQEPHIGQPPCSEEGNHAIAKGSPRHSEEPWLSKKDQKGTRWKWQGQNIVYKMVFHIYCTQKNCGSTILYTQDFPEDLLARNTFIRCSGEPGIEHQSMEFVGHGLRSRVGLRRHAQKTCS